MLTGIILNIEQAKDANSLCLYCQYTDGDCVDIYVSNNSNSQHIEIGDSVVVNDYYVYWTPKNSELTLRRINYDIPIPRVII
jgi:hypothetical protein